MNNKKRVFCITSLFALSLMIIFWKSFYWPYEELSKRKILMVSLVFFFVIIVPIMSVKINYLYTKIDNTITSILCYGRQLKADKKGMFQLLFVSCLVLSTSAVSTYLISKFILNTLYNIRMFYMITVVEVLSLFFFKTWRQAAEKVEKIFLVVVLCLGILFIGVTPQKTGVSWDDQIHYHRTLAIANFFNGVTYQADEKNIWEYVFVDDSLFDRQANEEYEQDIQSLYEIKECNINAVKDFGVWSVSYIPSAIGVILGRGLGLSYMGVYSMGRVFNLLTYAMLIYFAIKRIKYGKVLIATIGLIPTSIFMASAYSYDTWVTGFTILGFSYFFAELQEDTLLESRNALIMVGAIALGCLPKAIYFPILFPLFFMPKKKFRDRKQRKYYYIAIIIAGLFLVFSFLLPMLINGAGTGDSRGGAEVNSTEQIKFILKNPLAYAKILFKFGLEYIGINHSSRMLQSYAYVGQGSFYGIISMILIVVAFLDRGEDEKNYYCVKTAGIFGCAIAVILSITALYISFTAVASDTVAGVQGRYMIPTIYPALYCLGVGGTKHKINKNRFVCLPMFIIALAIIYSLTVLCVIPY